MRKKITGITLIALFITLGLASCDKLKEKLFTAFITNSADMDFTVNVINTIDTRSDIGSMTTNMNIDSIIKAETGDAFSLKDIKSINIEECKLTVLNPDATNNFANFEEGWLVFNTNAGAAPIQIATGLNPDVYSDTWYLPVDKTINLKDYLGGNTLAYIVAAKARRVTTKKLDCKMAIKFKVN